MILLSSIIPLFKLLKTPRKKYFYDVGKKEIVMISNRLFNDLRMVENGELSWNEFLSRSGEELTSLLDEGYLLPNMIKHIRHPFSDLCLPLLERKIDKITLQITQECNFRCKYCLYSEEANHKQRTHSNRTMTWETAKQAIDFYFHHSIDSPTRNIGFYGGEPLLKFDLIRRIVEYAEAYSKGKQLSFNITTNGSLLSGNNVRYFSEHHIKTLISLDGIKKVQDKNRVFSSGTGTFDVIATRLEEIRKDYPEYYHTISFNSVLTPGTDIDDVISLSEVFKGIPPENFQTNFVENTDTDIIPDRDYITKTEYHGMLAFMTFCGRYPKDRLSSMGANWLRDIQSSYQRFRAASFLPQTTAPGGPCLPGKSRLFIATDGQFYPCERVNESEHMRIGSLATGFDFKSIDRLLNIGELTEERCKNCWAIRHCLICAKMCDDGERLSAERKMRYCEKSKRVAETELRRIILCRELETGVYSFGA